MTLGLIVGIVFFLVLCIAVAYLFTHKPGQVRRTDRVIDE